jgi:hypothetical protein
MSARLNPQQIRYDGEPRSSVSNRVYGFVNHGTPLTHLLARSFNGYAVATAANSFFVVPSTSLGRDVEIGERLSLRFQRGLPSLDDDRTRAR